MEPSSAPWRALESTESGETTSGAGPEPEPRTVPWLVVAIVLAIGCAALGAFFLGSHSGTVVTVDGATALGATSDPGGPSGMPPGTPGGEIVVEVGGAVAHPGLYRLVAGSRIGDAIAAAGGYGPRVDTVAADLRLNLAAILHDGDEVHVPTRDEAATSSGAAGSGATGGGSGPGGGPGLIDLNTASAEQLDTLPGIGPATAAKIIAAREEQRFKSIDELGSRKVVGAATLAKIRPLVTVGP